MNELKKTRIAKGLKKENGWYTIHLWPKEPSHADVVSPLSS
jgi:hypothetical protein